MGPFVKNIFFCLLKQLVLKNNTLEPFDKTILKKVLDNPFNVLAVVDGSLNYLNIV